MSGRMGDINRPHSFQKTQLSLLLSWNSGDGGPSRATKLGEDGLDRRIFHLEFYRRQAYRGNDILIVYHGCWLIVVFKTPIRVQRVGMH